MARDWWVVGSGLRDEGGCWAAGVGVVHQRPVMPGMPAVMAMRSTQAPHALLAVPGKACGDGEPGTLGC